ncbi:MAG: hypothetical protein MI784_13165 [Cytophagales bacterium]|nr:hypothetical protein [Cytophagales bacterium]
MCRIYDVVKSLVLLVAGSFWACNSHKEAPALGSQQITLMENAHMRFEPDHFSQKIFKEDSATYRLESGRLLLKKVKLPDFGRDVRVTLDVQLKSAGDPWDKAGSLFVIPADSKVNFLTVKEGTGNFPGVSEDLEGFVGILPDSTYKPVLELMRFMTPFGVGYFNEHKRIRKPVYIPCWEDLVEWKTDVTPLISRLEGEAWVGVWIDTWTKEGYEISAKLQYVESKSPCDLQIKTKVEPLLNTTAYIGGQRGTDIFSRKNIKVAADIPENARNVRLHYITTGHGGHSEGDEFVRKQNVVMVDADTVINYVPWRDDCASFRRFNPSSGVWLKKDTARYYDDKAKIAKEKVIEERIASSDLSRSNWCPGSQVDPYSVPLTVKPGRHEFEFAIPEAQKLKPGELNFWMVSAYLTWEE